MTKKTVSRKSFLKIAGAATAGLGLAGCGVNSIPPDPEPEFNLGPDPNPNDYAVYLGSGDTGIFNFIYTLEQLEAAFFAQATERFYDGITDRETRILTDIAQHEAAHRDFYEAYLGDNAIQALQFEFFNTDFEDRESVLSTGRLIEDVVVSMYNRITEGIENARFIHPILKIASVEARHATALRTLLEPDTDYFIGPDIVTPNGLDAINTPSDVEDILFQYVVENTDRRDLPQF